MKQFQGEREHLREHVTIVVVVVFFNFELVEKVAQEFKG